MRHKRPFSAILLIILTLLVSDLPAAALSSAPLPALPPGLAFAQIKITGDEFLILKNNSSVALPDLSQYWLEDFNNVSPLAAGASNSSQQLPPVGLDAGQSLLLSNATRDTCGAEVAGKLSISLTDSGGFLELVQMTQGSNGVVVQSPGDVVSWSSTASGQIQNVPSSTKDPQGAYYRYDGPDNTFLWQAADIDATNACQLDVSLGSGTTASKQPITTGSLLSGGDSAPATLVSTPDVSDNATVVASLPAADIGLVAPEITELLPNPNGSGNDATDEYVELYNPNSSNFDLSNFSLQAGLTSLHSYQIPVNTILPPKSFRVFYSRDTSLSLSNTSGQVKLLDPFGNAVAQSDPYATANDGVAWALANGKWYWTTTLTPGAANVIKQPAAKTKKSSTSSAAKKSKTTSQVKAAKTAKSTGSTSDTSSASDVATVTPIHPWTLALVACLALLYGTYEYRADLKNHYHQLRRHWTARRAAR